MIAHAHFVVGPSNRVSRVWIARTVARFRRDLDAVVTGSQTSFELAEVRVVLAEWSTDSHVILSLDERIHAAEHAGPFVLTLVADDERTDEAIAAKILTRYQRLLTPRFDIHPLVAQALPHHRALYDVTRPLVRADYDHAMDTWRWLLRLEPNAGAPVQLAALFHDVERLRSEPERRIEHRAADYEAFAHAHAAASAAMVEEVFRRMGVDEHVVARTAALVAHHESAAGDDDQRFLNDADALSFFSLNAAGFYRHFGHEHTRSKVDHTLARMRPRARTLVRSFLHHPAVRAMIENEDTEPTRASHP